ncbi:MAG: polysaccharide deacetylase family protein [Ruminococcus sp.]|nr:polysaccharide deacetylase family protein [Ruminococcus sp.]
MNLRKFTAFVISAFCLVCSAGGNVSSFAQESATGEETKLVAITFDDGPNTHTTVQVLDLLEQYDAKASFFLIGDNISEASAPVVKRAYDMGCEINSHSKTHSHMTELTYDEIVAEMDYVKEKVCDITGEYPKFFRPPYLEVNDTMYDAIDVPFITGYSTSDSNSAKTAQERIDAVLNNVKDGSIFLMHDFYGNDNTVEALKTIIPALQEQGYELVTLSELFERKGEVPVDNYCYSEVQRHPCYGYEHYVNLFTGSAGGDSSWEGWNTETLLDGEVLAQCGDDFTVEVAYQGEGYPVFVLNRWKSSEDNFWKAVKPVYYNGNKACYRSEDILAVLDSYGVDFSGVNKILVKANYKYNTITSVDVLKKSETVFGDVNVDGVFNIADAVALQSFLLNRRAEGVSAWENGDFNGDGMLDVFDLCAMKKAITENDI